MARPPNRSRPRKVYPLPGAVPLPTDTAPLSIQEALTRPLYAQRLSELHIASSRRDQNRLSSLASPGALQWSLGPSSMVPLDSTAARTAFLYTLGMPCLPSSAKHCPNCPGTLDTTGDHAVTCVVTGQATRSHYELRQVLYNIAQAAGYAPQKEKSQRQTRAIDLLTCCSHSGQTAARSPLTLASHQTPRTRILDRHSTTWHAASTPSTTHNAAPPDGGSCQ